MQSNWVQDTLSKHDQTKLDAKDLFASYWHQIDEVNRFKPSSVLEVGIGNKFVSSYFQRLGYNMVTLDVLRGFEPMVVSSVLTLPFKEKSFDVCLCCEVLEHLPYEYFGNALSEFHRVSRKAFVMSLPDVSWCLSIKLSLTNLPLPFSKMSYVSFPRLLWRNYPFNGQHYWDIGKKGYGLKKIVRSINDAGFTIFKNYRVFEKPFHRFFVLKP